MSGECECASCQARLREKAAELIAAAVAAEREAIAAYVYEERKGEGGQELADAIRARCVCRPREES